ncbi:MAG: UDP-2,3-diacylglucosamine diphosphatase, partial [Gammaproteobacteria bacterium]|nr:UDP-2,3-diacylglucosamine diphosphatase [Gammaproteobacteria bacterium]
DLFEAWAGDDDTTPPHEDIISELADYSRSGHKLFIMRGNRDYLMSRQFTEKTGGQLLNDETQITLNEEKILLMHGDTLCTEDVKYQVFRRLVNNVFSRNFFMCWPYKLRTKVWHKIRGAAKRSAEKKSEYLNDVHQATVEAKMKKHDVLCLIHGHTHLQAIHEFKLEGQDVKRIVLGDWYLDDSVLVSNDAGLRLFGVDDYINQNS